MESAISYRDWPENLIMTLFPMDGVLLEVRNRKERCCAWSPVAMTSHVQTLNMFFAKTQLARALPCSFQVPAIRLGLALCVSNFGRIHFLLLVIVQL
jgi:hypothetical protein